MSAQKSIRRDRDWITRLLLPSVLISAFLMAGVASAEPQRGDWPVRLTFERDREHPKSRKVIVAHNLADFTCHKLRLLVTIEGGRLLSGSGHSTARMVDGRLEFDEVATLRAGEKIKWKVDFRRTSSRSTTDIRADLEYTEKGKPRPKPRPAPAPRRRVCTEYTPTVGDDMTIAELAFPTGHRATSALLVHQVMPREVNRNKVYEYQYHVTNVNVGDLQNVELQAYDFQNLEVIESNPAHETDADGLRWSLGDLGACETKVIHVKASSGDLGSASACLAASFRNRLCALTKVVEPALRIVKTATREALLCEEAEVVLTVSNPGTGVARNVQVTDQLPDGLMTTDGERLVEGDAGDLQPGESAGLSFKVKASRTGKYSNEASARADGDLTAESNKTTTVFRQPVVGITASCPDQRYIGRTADFCFDVRSTGDAVAADTVVTASIPQGSEVVEIGSRGSQQANSIVWRIGTLRPDETRQVCFKARASAATTMRSDGRVGATCADPVEDGCATRVIGIPAILLEVIDLEDPIEVGQMETYVITVTNQGTAPDTNIRIDVVLPDEEQYVSATGATTARVAGQKISFAPVPKLDPKKRVEWRLTVRASRPGDVRFAVEMNSDRLTTPVNETEATNLYE